MYSRGLPQVGNQEGGTYKKRSVGCKSTAIPTQLCTGIWEEDKRSWFWYLPTQCREKSKNSTQVSPSEMVTVNNPFWPLFWSSLSSSYIISHQLRYESKQPHFDEMSVGMFDMTSRTPASFVIKFRLRYTSFKNFTLLNGHSLNRAQTDNQNSKTNTHITTHTSWKFLTGNYC